MHRKPRQNPLRRIGAHRARESRVRIMLSVGAFIVALCALHPAVSHGAHALVR